MKIIQTGIAFAVGLLVAAPAWGDVTVDVNGQAVSFDQPPVMQGGRVLVPLRGVFERLGASVSYQASDRSITAQSGATSIHLQIGSTTASVNGQQQPLDQAPIVMGSRVLVPLRFVSEALGAQVGWNDSQQLVSITGGAPGDQDAPSQSYHSQRPRPITQVVNITLVQVDNRRMSREPIRPGHSLDITIHGAPHGRATFDIGSNHAIEMREGPSGTYTGKYLVRASDVGHQAALTVHLTDQNGKVTSQTSDQKVDFTGGGANQQANRSVSKQPLIRSVVHNGSGQMSVGQVLRVTMLGAPGGRASFDVGSHVGLPMKEISSGTYVGEFAAPAGDASQSARVLTHLSMPNGATMSLVAPTSVSFLGRSR